MTRARKTRIGRPPSPPEQLQTRGAYVRGTEAQHAAWAAAAAAEGVPVAEWHRRLADAAVAAESTVGRWTRVVRVETLADVRAVVGEALDRLSAAVPPPPPTNAAGLAFAMIDKEIREELSSKAPKGGE